MNISHIDNQVSLCHSGVDSHILFVYCIAPIIKQLILSLFSDKVSSEEIQVLEFNELCINEHYYNIPIIIQNEHIIERISNFDLTFETTVYNELYEYTKYYDTPILYNICYFVDMTNSLQLLINNHTMYFNHNIEREEIRNIVESIIYSENIIDALQFVVKNDKQNIMFALESIDNQMRTVLSNIINSLQIILHTNIEMNVDREDLRQEIEYVKQIIESL